MVTQSIINLAICCASDNVTTIEKIFDADPAFVQSDGHVVLSHYATRAEDGSVIFRTLLTKYIQHLPIKQLNRVLIESIEYDQCTNVRLLLDVCPALFFSEDYQNASIFQCAAPLRLSEPMCDVLFSKITKATYYLINRDVRYHGCMMTLAQIAAKNGNVFFLKHLFACDMTSLTRLATQQRFTVVNDKSTLELAVEQREIECARFLVAVCPRLCRMVSTSGLVVPLLLAVRNANLPMIELLARADPSVLCIPGFHINPFVGAVRRLYFDIVQLFFQLEPSCIQMRDMGGRSVLLHTNSKAMVEFLLQLDPTVIDIVDESGKTTLHHAAQTGSPMAVISYLLAVKPSLVYQTDNQGQTPLGIAFRNLNYECMKAMVVACPTVQFYDKHDNTTCHIAARVVSNVETLHQVFTTNAAWLTLQNNIALNPLAIALLAKNQPATTLLMALMPVGDVVETFCANHQDVAALQKQCHDQCDANALLPDLWDCVLTYVGFPSLTRNKRKHNDNP